MTTYNEFQVVGLNKDRARKNEMVLGFGRTLEAALLDFSKTLARFEKTNTLDIMKTFHRVRLYSKSTGYLDFDII